MSTSNNYKNNISRVRELLTSSPDGLTLREIIEETGLTYSCAYKAVERIRGAHVDRWTPDTRPWVCKWQRVFRIEVPPPEDAPMPDVPVKQYLASFRG